MPAKLRQNDSDARWTVKVSKAKPGADGKTQRDIAVPTFGDQNPISIDRTMLSPVVWFDGSVLDRFGCFVDC